MCSQCYVQYRLSHTRHVYGARKGPLDFMLMCHQPSINKMALLYSAAPAAMSAQRICSQLIKTYTIWHVSEGTYRQWRCRSEASSCELHMQHTPSNRIMGQSDCVSHSHARGVQGMPSCGKSMLTLAVHICRMQPPSGSLLRPSLHLCWPL